MLFKVALCIIPFLITFLMGLGYHQTGTMIFLFLFVTSMSTSGFILFMTTNNLWQYLTSEKGQNDG